MAENEAINPLFTAALRVLPPESMYDRTIHAGGPRPSLGPVAQAQVALFCGERILPLIADPRARARAAERLRSLAEGVRQRDHQVPPRPRDNDRDGREGQPDRPEDVVELAALVVAHARRRSQHI